MCSTGLKKILTAEAVIEFPNRKFVNGLIMAQVKCISKLTAAYKLVSVVTRTRINLPV